MVRAFAAATGFSVMRYVRARRLSEAARALADGAPDILSLALDADYGSHEAFTRAFRDHFGVTPETVRATTCLDQLKLQEPIVMDSTPLDHLKPPRFETGKALLVAGIGERYNLDNAGAGIPNQWQRFHQSVGQHSRPGREGRLWRLLQRRRCRQFRLHRRCRGRRTSPTCRANSARVRIPEQKYAVFTHGEHISTIRRTVNTIWNQWLPAVRT